eukprot:XP_011681695.1 PREDICTED: trehalase [Strongylocentrotus purpuratus]
MVGMAGTSFLLSALVMTYAVTWSAADLKDEAPCASSIFCNGLLLKAAQNAMIYNDSKTFVDLHLKQSEDVILQAFGELVDRTDANVMREFVAEYFDGPNIEFEDWEPSDWKENPGFIDGIKDDELKEWARDLNELWKELGRQIKQDVLTNADRYSLIHVENPFIVPGGRFREFYYWDSYWIFKGLLLSEMTETVKGMLTNFVSISKSIGHVPNGNRVYYEKRSQPPFLIPSVYLYLQATDDIETIRTFLPDLEIEYQFWMTDRAIDITKDANVYTLNRYNVNMGMPSAPGHIVAVTTVRPSGEELASRCVYLAIPRYTTSTWACPGNNLTAVLPRSPRSRRCDRAIDITKNSNVYTLNRYNVNMGMPRPESYREDIETADGKNEEEAAEVYSNLASAAESGWDFSTRWFRDGATLGSIRTKEIVPVDLNSVLCLSEWALYEMYNTTGNESKAATYLQAFNDRKRAISEVLWSEDEGAWFDYDIVDEDIVDQFYPSNIMPMWASCYDDTNDIQQQVLDYLKKEGVLEFPGGIPTSLTKSGQQWDYPNAWPPLQDIVIETLRKSDVEEANDYALKLAQNWTLTNWRAYKETDLMFEKYDVEKQGVPGHGGEYAVQEAAEVYSNLASAAESGWDFSTRWFRDGATLGSIRTKEIVPVDLNSVLCLSEWALYEMYNTTGLMTIGLLLRNINSFLSTNNIIRFQYDVEKQGVPGHGGEYAVQAGFGWTNGVIMSLLDHYGDQLEVGETGSSGHATVFILLNVVCLFAALILARDE